MPVRHLVAPCALAAAAAFGIPALSAQSTSSVHPTPPPVAAAPKDDAVASVAPAAAEPPHDTQGTARPVDRKWTFPSSDSIPAVSIMKSEPPLPKSAELPEPKVDPDLAKSVGASPEPATSTEAPRLPPKRPQTEAAPTPEPR